MGERGPVILNVENETFLHDLIKRALERVGKIPVENILYAKDSHEALEILNNPDKKPDLVLLDIYLSDGNQKGGLEFLRKIRESDSPVNKVPVIVMTTDQSWETQRQCEKFKINGFFVKPIIDIHTFIRVVNEALGIKNNGN